jgi:hypothetical protein
MPIQIKRHLIILATLIIVFIVFRQIMIPDSFGELGHYRANSLIDNQLFDLHYAGQETCFECHEDMSELKEMDLHFSLSCETCHGPGLDHISSPDSLKPLIPDNRNHCGLCHNRNAAKNEDVVLQIDLKEHNSEKNCTYCHNPHAPWELRNQDLPEENF